MSTIIRSIISRPNGISRSMKVRVVFTSNEISTFNNLYSSYIPVVAYLDKSLTQLISWTLYKLNKEQILYKSIVNHKLVWVYESIIINNNITEEIIKELIKWINKEMSADYLYTLIKSLETWVN